MCSKYFVVSDAIVAVLLIHVPTAINVKILVSFITSVKCIGRVLIWHCFEI